MGQFGNSDSLFENIEGKIQEKLLGIKLMEVSFEKENKAKRVLKDVGDTALFLCGYFAESLNRKILDIRYYQNVGKLAYHRLDFLVPTAYEHKAFYKQLSKDFENLTVMIKVVSLKNKQEDSFNPYLIFPKSKKN